MKKLTVNESLRIAMLNRDIAIHDLECENSGLRAERERLREMVARYIVVAAEAQDGERAYKNFILSIKSLELRNVGEA